MEGEKEIGKGEEERVEREQEGEREREEGVKEGGSVVGRLDSSHKKYWE